MGNYCCSRFKEDCFKIAGYTDNQINHSQVSNRSNNILSNSSIYNKNQSNRKVNVEYSSMFISPLNTPSPSDLLPNSISSSDCSVKSIYSNLGMTSSTELEIA